MKNTSLIELIPSAIIPFSYESKEIRIIKDEFGNPWWVAKDVCDILDISNVTMAMERIPEKHLTSIHVRAGGQIREMNAVDEPGLYRLILRSDKPQAEPFMEWVTSEILPQIRSTGSYQTGDSSLKYCKACNTRKPKSSFFKCAIRKDGLQAYCKSCHAGKMDKMYFKKLNAHKETLFPQIIDAVNQVSFTTISLEDVKDMIQIEVTKTIQRLFSSAFKIE